MDWKNPLVQKVLEWYQELCNEQQKFITFCWIPSHIWIKGNEAADAAAKAALNRRITGMCIPHADFKQYINKLVKQKWQTAWDQAVYNKLHTIQPTLGKWSGSSRKICREETVLELVTATSLTAIC